MPTLRGRRPFVTGAADHHCVHPASWAFYAFAWLVVGPEGRASCKCWTDFYNDWQYQAQFVVALGGAVCLVAAAGLYVMRRRVAFGVTGTLAALAACGWIVFLLTGLG